MNKAEFIGYLTALEDMVDNKAELKLIQKIKKRAESLDLSYTYPYYPYYPNIWYGATKTGISKGTYEITPNSTVTTGQPVTLTNANSWSVNTLPNGDFEIKK